jgi:hypothetical protein
VLLSVHVRLTLLVGRQDGAETIVGRGGFVDNALTLVRADEEGLATGGPGTCKFYYHTFS